MGSPEADAASVSSAAVPALTAEPGMEVAPYTRLSPAEQSKVQEIREAIDLNDPQAVLQFGLPAQNRIAAFADTLLADVRAKDTGYVGEALNGLLQRVKDVDVDALSASAEGSDFGAGAGVGVEAASAPVAVSVAVAVPRPGSPEAPVSAPTSPVRPGPRRG